MNSVSTTQLPSATQSLYRILNAVPFAVVVLKAPSLIIEYINHRYLSILEQSREEVIGKSLFTVRPELCSILEPALAEAAHSGKHFEQKELRFDLTKQDGKQVSYQNITIDPVLDEKGNITEWVCTISDITSHRETAEALEREKAAAEKQQQLHETITNNTPDLIYVFNLNYRFTYANKALLAMWGQTWEGAIGKGLRDLGYEEWHAAMHEREIDEIVATKQNVRGTVSFPHAELGRRIYDYILTPVLNEKGEVTAVAGTTRDISDIKNSEDRLKESENRFRSLANDTPAFLFTADADTSITFANRQWLNFAGLTSEDGLGKAWMEMTHPDDMDSMMHTYSEGIAKGKPYQVEIRQRNTAGEWRWILWNGIPRNASDGGFIGVVGIGIDVTEQKRTEELIRQSEEKFRQLADLVPQILWTARPDGSIDYYNKQWYDFTRLPLDARDEEWAPYIHPEDVQRMDEVWMHSIATGELYQHEFRLKDAETGEYRWFFAKAVPVYDETGKLVKWFGATNDINDQKEVSEKLEDLVAERTSALDSLNIALLRSNEDLQQFAHVASHDLKEPVRKVLTFTSRLKDELETGSVENKHFYISRVEAAARRMYSMIDGVLSYSSLNALEAVKESVDLNKLLRDIETDLEVVIQQNGAMLIHNNLPTVQGSTVLLYQLFYNLVNNSLKFARKGVPPEIVITPQEEEDTIRITVQDNGIGFDQSQSKKIFQTFSRLHAKDKYEGTGLGLSLCKKIAERHGGTIQAEGKEGEGAKITVLLPNKSN